MVLMGSRDPSTHVVDVSKTVTALHQTGRDGNNAGHGRGHDNPANSFNEEKRVALSNGPSTRLPSSDSSQFPSTCSSLPLVFGCSKVAC